MRRAGDERDSVEHAVVCVYLIAQTIEVVEVAFYLEHINAFADDDNIDARRSTLNTQLLKRPSARLGKAT